MAKRHHESKAARHREHAGMERYERGPVKHHDAHVYEKHSSDLYSGYSARRHQEMQDAGMIHENPHAIANLPQEVMIKPYPHVGAYMPEGLDDTIRGVDAQMNYDDAKRKQHMMPKKV